MDIGLREKSHPGEFLGFMHFNSATSHDGGADCSRSLTAIHKEKLFCHEG